MKVDWQTYQSAQKKVEELLTAEQKETLKQPLKWGQAGGGFAGGGVGVTQPCREPAGPSQPILDRPERRAPWSQQRKKLELPDDQGLTVNAVLPESPAAKAGIKAQDVILTAGDKPLKGIRTWFRPSSRPRKKTWSWGSSATARSRRLP